MTTWAAVKRDFRKYNPWSTAVSFYFLVMGLDWVSSLINNKTPGVMETNPFVRNEQMQFVLRKGMVVDLFWFTALVLVAVVLNQVVGHWRARVGRAVSAGIFAYFAIDRLLSAVVGNFLIAIHFYVPDPTNILKKLLGL